MLVDMEVEVRLDKNQEQGSLENSLVNFFCYNPVADH